MGSPISPLITAVAIALLLISQRCNGAAEDIVSKEEPKGNLTSDTQPASVIRNPENENKDILNAKPPQVNTIPRDTDSVVRDDQLKKLPDATEAVVPKTENNEIPAPANRNTDNAINHFSHRLSHTLFKPRSHQDALSNQSANTDKTTNPTVPTLIWSPYSVHQSLVPLLYAAGGETLQELRSSLLTSSSPSEEELTDLNFRNTNAFSSATALFSRKDFPLNEDYVEELHNKVRNANVKQINFHNVSTAVKTINQWVTDSTRGLIDEAVNEGQVDPDTFLMIVNCVRFKAPWTKPFDPELTEISQFHGVSGDQQVMMMSQRSFHKYAQFPILIDPNAKVHPVPFSAVELSYEGDDFVSLFVLPNSTKDIYTTMDYLEEMGVENLRKALGPVDIQLNIPKFSLSSDVAVGDALVNSGLRTLFNPKESNLSRLIPKLKTSPPPPPQGAKLASEKSSNVILPAPYVSKVIHKTIFEVSEEGTSAGAVTMLSIVPLSAFSDYNLVRFTLNRPFIVILVKENTIVFEGIVADLKGQKVSAAKTSQSAIPSRNNFASDEKLASSDLQPKIALQSSIDIPANLTSNADENILSQVIDPPSPETPKADENSWWIPKQTPAYLLPSKADKPKEGTIPNQAAEPQRAPPKVASPVVPTKPEPAPVIVSSKFQQPEPKDPAGIRFPISLASTRRKVVSKPRSEEIRAALLQWLNGYRDYY